MDDRESGSFTYTYSASQQEEVRRIRQKYAPPQTDGMALLRSLDARAARPGRAAALTVGIAGTLLLGLGMSMTMAWTGLFAPGIAVGLLGLALIAAAYPLCRAVTRRRREKLAPQILALTDELLGGE